jgi:hypothetical protein
MQTLVHKRPDTITWPPPHVAFTLPRTAYPFGHPADECPACHSEQMYWVANENLEYNYLCEECGRCWSLSSVGATRVNPGPCRDCDHRVVCLEELRKEIATCGLLPTGQ